MPDQAGQDVDPKRQHRGVVEEGDRGAEPLPVRAEGLPRQPRRLLQPLQQLPVGGDRVLPARTGAV